MIKYLFLFVARSMSNMVVCFKLMCLLVSDPIIDPSLRVIIYVVCKTQFKSCLNQTKLSVYLVSDPINDLYKDM
jgi:hypothetical protein